MKSHICSGILPFLVQPPSSSFKIHQKSILYSYTLINGALVFRFWNRIRLHSDHIQSQIKGKMTQIYIFTFLNQ